MKKHRLPEAAYYGRKTVSFTACETNRRPILTDPPLVAACVHHLAQAAEENRCIVPIYTFMPDHLHVVIMGTDDSSRPKRAMERFKHASGRWFAKHHPAAEWQDDYYDRIVRSSHDWPGHIRYVALNPVRKGLCQTPEAWPHTGSIGCDLNEILGDAFFS